MKRILLIIFLFAVGLRFIYFPDNVYFGYDQARDAYTSLGILEGDFKVKGPSASFNSNIFHGALSYYIFAPLYFLSDGDPTLVSIFLRIYNASGIFLVFLIAASLFNKKVGLLSAILYAVSYEQTQYSLFLSHPSLAVITVLLFYYGLVELFIKHRIKGLVIASIGLGLSIQFHFSLLILGAVFLVLLIIFNLSKLKSKNLPSIMKALSISNVKYFVIALVCFLITISTFLISELKYGDLSKIISATDKTSVINTSNIIESGISHIYILSRDNLFALGSTFTGLTIIISLFTVGAILSRKYKQQLIFLTVWFAAGVVPYFINYSKIYYYGIGGSAAILILTAFIIYKLSLRFKPVALSLLLVIIVSNIYLITINNKTKFNENIIVQEGLVLPVEKQVIDYIYNKSEGQNFSVNAAMIPFNVNTTWDYLFNWYGNKKYGYLPVWGGDAAPGYQGKLEINTSRSKLPKKRFLIIEPSKNIPKYMIDSLIEQENYFSKVVEEKTYGNIIVQYREAI